MRNRLSNTLVLFIALGGFGWALAQTVFSNEGPPNHLPYRGHLEQDGLALNGTHNLTFFVVDDAADTSAEALWSDDYPDVPVQGGDFSVVLGGGTTPFPAGLFGRGALYVGVIVNGTEMTGKQRLLRTAYTVEAAHGPPPGSMMIYAGVTPPDGWMWAEGATLNIADYPRLFSAISTTYGGNGTTNFQLPDMRDRYVIGSGVSAAQGEYAFAHTKDHDHNAGSLGAHVGVGWIAAEGNRVQLERIVNDTFPVSNRYFDPGPYSNGDSIAGVERTVVSGSTASSSVDVRPASIGMRYIIKW